MGAFDGFEFATGMAVGETGKGHLRGLARGWKEQAVGLAEQLEDATQVAFANIYRNNGAIALIQEMLEEIQESNPNSPLANRAYVKERLKVLAEQNALQDGYELDYENNRVTPK